MYWDDFNFNGYNIGSYDYGYSSELSYASGSLGFDNNNLSLDYNHGNTSTDNRSYDFGIFRSEDTYNNNITNNYPGCPVGQKDCYSYDSKDRLDSHWCVGKNENC
ncbi:MAG: hypothetical protein OEY79_01985 [Anaplasmataceae bacterium]|nr:hypothetical protein [Anaplasmataceae bacterium]